MKQIIFLIFTIFLSACKNKRPENQELMSDRIDTHSFSKPNIAKTTHLDLKLNVDFDAKTLKGSAGYEIEHNNASEIILDLRNLKIDRIIDQTGEILEFKIGENHENLGSSLAISLNNSTRYINIYYETQPDAAALQWLEPNQTTDKRLPFLFTQGQAILTRTWIPCQDSPGVRITYNAELKVPDNMMAVMSANNPTEKNKSGIYNFSMKQPIPSYLIAMAVGDLVFGKIGARTGVYSEPSMLEKSLYEFEDMEKMLVSAEALYGPYLWEKYDVIVLPSSFPFGGMENPRLTFATPTIIAGDKSLTSLIAHELAHSWSGNLVTNATWNDFWLNEGFTVYFERRIMEAIYGKEYANMLAVLGYQDLENTVDHIGHTHSDTHLKLDLKGRDPDDGMTDIAYEKGAYFLMMLESKFGREVFDKFVKDYFEKHKFQTITTDEFIRYLNTTLLKDDKHEIDINAWIFEPGIPSNVTIPHSDKFQKVDQSVKDLLDNEPISEHNWSTHEWLHFIRKIPENTNLEILKKADQKFNFSNSKNAEIAAAWFELSIQSGYNKNNIEQIETFLISIGRRKFLTPLYTALKDKGELDTATNIYKKARKNYHAVSTQTIDKLLEYQVQ